MVVRGSACRAAMDVTKVDAGVEHGRDVGVPKHVRVHPSDTHPRDPLQAVQAAGGGVPVHPPPGPVQQDRPRQPVGNGTVDGAGHGWRRRHEDDLVGPCAGADVIAPAVLRHRP